MGRPQAERPGVGMPQVGGAQQVGENFASRTSPRWVGTALVGLRGSGRARIAPVVGVPVVTETHALLPTGLFQEKHHGTVGCPNIFL